MSEAAIEYARLSDSMERMAWSKRTWLEDHSDGRNKRPEHEIETKRQELYDLEFAANIFKRQAERNAANG